MIAFAEQQACLGGRLRGHDEKKYRLDVLLEGISSETPRIEALRADDSDKIVWVMHISQRGGDAVVT